MSAQRRIEYIPLSQIQRARRNPKMHDSRSIEASLHRFGIGELPLIDERTGLLVAGEGRIDQLEVMRDADPNTPPEGITRRPDGDWLVPVIKGWASRDDKEADAYLIMSNRLSARGGWHDEGLAEMLASLDQDLVGIGYDPDELEDLLRATGYDPDALATLSDAAANIPEFTDPGPDDTPPPAPRPPVTPPRNPFATSGAPAPTPPPQAAPQPSGVLPPPAAPASTEPQWFQLTWTATHLQREVIHEAIHKGRERFGVDSAVAALAAVCGHYLTGTGGEQKKK